MAKGNIDDPIYYTITDGTYSSSVYPVGQGDGASALRMIQAGDSVSSINVIGTVPISAGSSLEVIQVSGAVNSVNILSTVSTPVTGTFWQTTQPISVANTLEVLQVSGSAVSVNVFQLGGTNIATGTGVAGAGVLRMVQAVDSTSSVNVTGTVSVPAGTNAIGKLLPADIDVTTHTNYAKKYYTNAGAVTDGIIWSPAAGKRWHVTCLYINVSAAAVVTIEDDLVAGDSAVFKADFAANSGVVIPFGEMYPLASGEDAADLLITTSAANVYVTAVGYEI